MTSINIYTLLSSKPHNPHYLKRYLKFIESCSGSGKVKHHICPKAKDMFPDYESLKDHPWNCSLLSDRHHFIAHWMLWKTFGSSMALAFHLMNDFKNISSKVYEQSRKEFVQSISGKNSHWFKRGYIHKPLPISKKSMIGYVNPMKGKIGHTAWNKGLVGVYNHSEESIEKLKIATSGEKNPMYGKQHSEESKSKIRETRLKLNIGKGEDNPMFGKSHTDESKLLQKESWKIRDFIICPHCSSKSINAANMKRWHFDNCKKKLPCSF